MYVIHTFIVDMLMGFSDDDNDWSDSEVSTSIKPVSSQNKSKEISKPVSSHKEVSKPKSSQNENLEMITTLLEKK